MESKSLFRKVEKTIEAIERSPDASSTIAQTAAAIVENLRGELGITGGRLWQARDGGFELIRTFGSDAPVTPGVFVGREYPAIARVLDEGVVMMGLEEPGVDPAFEHSIGVDHFFAAIAVGDDEYVLSFSVHPNAPREELVASLSILRHAVDQKLRQDWYERLLAEARQIQMSILPKRPPRTGEFDIAGFSTPAEVVGGDFFDFIPVSDRIVGLAIADASGHGLPAALQVRDVFTGLRMGVARDFKITRTVERLNRIIHQSRLTTKFVSLFYGELENDGNLIYVNAGHPPPLHFHSRGTTLLRQTGLVLGPSAAATYNRGFLQLDRGDALLMYTDGMVEAADSRGREFGMERLKKTFQDIRDRDSQEITKALLERVREFTGNSAPADDRTVVVIRRLASPPATAGPEPVRSPRETPLE
jgi:sigma-B regulation protein RsbU (phosphoserine phosphatase)